MPRRKSIRSQLYRAARELGDLEAAENGPSAYGHRVARPYFYRQTNRATASFLRALGLSARR